MPAGEKGGDQGGAGTLRDDITKAVCLFRGFLSLFSRNLVKDGSLLYNKC